MAAATAGGSVPEAWRWLFGNAAAAAAADEEEDGHDDDDGEEEEEEAGFETAEIVTSDGAVMMVAAGGTAELAGWGRKAAGGDDDVKPDIVAVDGTEAESSRRRRRGDLAEEVCMDDSLQLGVAMQGRKRRATVTPDELQIAGIGIENKKGQAQYLRVRVEDVQRFSEENENLRLQLAIKNKELEHEENKRLKLELAMKNMEIEYLQKQNEELKTENGNYKKTTKPPRCKRLCRICKTYEDHDYRNCPKRKSYEEQEEPKKTTPTSTGQNNENLMCQY